MDAGSAGDISLPINLSTAIISAAYHRSGQLAAAEEAVNAAKKAEQKELKMKPLLRSQPHKQLLPIDHLPNPKHRFEKG